MRLHVNSFLIAYGIYDYLKTSQNLNFRFINNIFDEHRLLLSSIYLII